MIAEINPLGLRKDLTYNAQGQLTKIQLPAVPDPLVNNTLTRPTFHYEYNEQGQMTKLTDARGRVTRFGFNAQNQATSRTLPSGEQESFTYDARNRQSLHVTFEGVHVRMVYDDSPTGGGRLREKQFFENANAYNNGSGIPTERLVLTYDAFDRVVRQQQIRADVTDTYTTAYDDQGRVNQETTPTGTIQYQYDVLGRKTQCRTVVSTVPTDILTEITYTYDSLGKLSTVNTVKRDGVLVDSNGSAPGTPPESTSYFYDLLGRLDYATLPNEVVEDYSWDGMDRLDVVRHFRSDADNANLANNILKSEFDYTYRADGKRTQMVERFGTMAPLPPGGSGWGEGVVTNRYVWQYDDAGRLISEVLDSSDNALDQTETYIMDLVGNRIRRTIDKPGSAEDVTDLYVYDANDRILSEARYRGLFPTDPPAGSSVRSTTYGWTGTQQTSRSVSEGTVTRSTQSFTYGLGGQLERVVTTTLDAGGAVTGRTRVDYRYNPQGIRFIAVDWNDANLDGTFAAGERTGSVEYLIDNSNFTGYQQTILETVKNAEGQATKRITYTFGLDEITQTVSELDPTSQLITQTSTLTYGHDGKGSVRVLFEAAAAIAQVLTYSAYGELLAIHNSSGLLTPHTSPLTTYLYNGEGYDTRTGLYNMRARWYSPTNARWERLDPFAGNPNDPFSFHKYGFVHGDPIMGTDPTGMFGIGIGGLGMTMSVIGATTGITGGVYYAVLGRSPLEGAWIGAMGATGLAIAINKVKAVAVGTISAVLELAFQVGLNQMADGPGKPWQNATAEAIRAFATGLFDQAIDEKISALRIPKNGATIRIDSGANGANALLGMMVPFGILARNILAKLTSPQQMASENPSGRLDRREALKAIIEAIAVYATNESGGNGIVLAAKKLGFPDSVATRFGKVASKIVLLPPRGNYSDFAEQAARAIEPTLDLVIEFVEGVVGRAGSELGNLVPDDES